MLRTHTSTKHAHRRLPASDKLQVPVSSSPLHTLRPVGHSHGVERAGGIVNSRILYPSSSCSSPSRVAVSSSSTAPSTVQPRNLVVAVDDTEDSWHAVRWTLEHVYKDGDVLHLLHVIPKNSLRLPLPAAFLAGASDSMDFEEMLEQHAREFINATMVGLATAKRATCEVDLVKGASGESVADAICKKSEALSAAVVVVAHQQKGLIEEWLSGSSVSRHVAQRCKQPTLIYQPHMDPVAQMQRLKQQQSAAAQS